MIYLFRCQETGEEMDWDYPIGTAPEFRFYDYKLFRRVFHLSGTRIINPKTPPSMTVSLEDAKKMGYKGVDPRDVKT